MVVHRFGAFALNTQTYELHRDGKTIPVEPQVFGVLKHLIENRVRVVSKDDLIDAVWEGRIVSDATLSKRISAARHAVDDTGETQTVIRTVPRRGFRFVADFSGTDDDSADGVVPTKPVPAFREVPGRVSIAVARRWRIPAIAAAVVVIIAAGGLAWWQPWVAPVEPTPVAQVEPASPESKAFPLPDKPSIAVLPFKNLSGDSFAEVFLGDVTENVATALSQVPDLFVIARTSTLPYKGKPVKVQQVAEELGVRYVLAGSVKRSGDQVRITAKLIDTRSGNNLWAESYDRELLDAAAVQGEITRNVVTALEVKLIEGARARIVRGNTNNPEAYSLVRRGLSLYQGGTQAENAEARRLFEKAVALDPDYSIGWHLLGYTHNASSRSGWGEDLAQERARAEELARKAMAIDPSAAGPYILLSTISRLRIRFNEAVAHGAKAVALAPNDAMTAAHMGRILIFAARHKEALPLIQQAIRLSPYTTPPILFFEGLGYHSLGRYGEEIKEFHNTILGKAGVPIALLAITSADMGRTEEARVAVQAILNYNSRRTAKRFVNLLAFEDRAKSEHALATLIRLGLPE